MFVIVKKETCVYPGSWKFMIKKIKNITSLLILVVFLLPTFAKLEHKHDYLKFDLKNKRDIPALRNNCPICIFEFSTFISNAENYYLQDEILSDNYSNNYNSQYYSNLSQFSFSLRGPPVMQI